MGKGTIGAAVGVLAWLGAATAAEAQGIGVDITGPSRVYHNQSISLMEANISGVSVFSWWLKVKHNGVQKHYSAAQGGSGTYIYWNVCYMNQWGMVAGDTLEYTVKVWVGTNNKTDVHTITVEQAPLTMVPSDRRQMPRDGGVQEALAWLARKDVEVLA